MHVVNICAFGRKTQFAENPWENFPKFWKNLLRKLRNMHYFRRVFTKFKKPCVNSLQVRTKKDNLLDILRKLSKIWKFFFRKLQKMHYFIIFSKRFNRPCLDFFAHLDEKDYLGNSEKIFEKFKKFLRKLRKLNYFSIFFKNI